MILCNNHTADDSSVLHNDIYDQHDYVTTLQLMIAIFYLMMLMSKMTYVTTL